MSDKKIKFDFYESTLKDLIKNYHTGPESTEMGIVLSNLDGVFSISGMKNVQSNEVIIIDDKYYAIALSLKADCIGAISLNDFSSVSDGMSVKRTGKVFSVGVGDIYLGRVVNAMGLPMDDLGDITCATRRIIESPSPSVLDRQTVSRPMSTGLMIVDALVPIGKGQRQLIVGDRRTGKSSIALSAILNQKGKDCICIYVSIGKKNSSLNQVIKKLKDADAMDYTVVVSASASDLPSLKFIAPFVATTIAEYWMHEGKDVLIVYDDLSQHAIAYRTVSLLLNMPPGREAYPGDIFFLHSRLLERSGQLSEEKGGGSITSLPIIETQDGDISSYIPSNVISITDGQLFLKSLLFNSGQKPAVDLTLSVSRVGGSAQLKSHRKLSGDLKLTLSSYYELLDFAQFGTDLMSKHNRDILENGAKIMKAMIQDIDLTYSPREQLILLYLIRTGGLKQVELNDVEKFLTKLLDMFRASAIWDDIDETAPVDEINFEPIKALLMKCLKLQKT